MPRRDNERVPPAQYLGPEFVLEEMGEHGARRVIGLSIPQVLLLAVIAGGLITTDENVAVDHARRIFEAARHPKSFIALAGADHLLSAQVDSLYVARVLSTWASRYLGEQSGRQRPADPLTASAGSNRPNRATEPRRRNE